MNAYTQARPLGMGHAQREERRRGAALAVVEDGDDPAAVAQRAGVPTSTVNTWARAYRTGGESGVAPHVSVDGPPRLAAAQIRQVRGLLIDADPREYGYSPSLWSRDLVRTLVQDRLRIALSGPATTRLLRRLGIALRRPQEDLRSDQPLRDHTTRSREEALVYAAAMAVQVQDQGVGRAEEVAAEAIETMTVFSAASARGCVRFSAISGPLNATTVVRFVSQLCDDAMDPLVVVVGADAVYDSPQLRTYLDSVPGGVRVHQICSPRLER